MIKTLQKMVTEGNYLNTVKVRDSSSWFRAQEKVGGRQSWPLGSPGMGGTVAEHSLVSSTLGSFRSHSPASPCRGIEARRVRGGSGTQQDWPQPKGSGVWGRLHDRGRSRPVELPGALLPSKPPRH